MQTEAMRSAKYVTVLRERFGPDAADRVIAVADPVGEWDGPTCGEQCMHPEESGEVSRR
jgi:hypothetical protein